MMTKNAKYYQSALKKIPWATQTNAKRINTQWGDSMPPFIKKAQGCRVWDLDDREYIDFRCALGPIILGYRYPDVDAAVREQMQNGVLFSMASPIELETAEVILKNVPWLEQIRFMKTGADACTACVRLARAFTNREHILTSGYHGYHDWFALDWPKPGIPVILKNYVHNIVYNDLEALDKVFDTWGEKLAAAIIEPYDWNEVAGVEFLQKLRQKCDKYGTVLIYDEVLTGFRLAPGGAQEYFGVTPDLAAFAKAMANGYPVSAFAGKEKYMSALNETIITTTYAGETLSLAASKATMTIMRNEPVHEQIHKMGALLKTGFEEIIEETGVPAHSAGLSPAPYIQFDLETEEQNLKIQNRFFSQLFRHSIFPGERWFINYSHTTNDIEKTLEGIRMCLEEIL